MENLKQEQQKQTQLSPSQTIPEKAEYVQSVESIIKVKQMEQDKEISKSEIPESSNNKNIWIIIAIIVLVIGGYLVYKKFSQAKNTLDLLTSLMIIKGDVFENQYMKVTVPSDWKIIEATRKIQNQSYDKTTGKTTLIGAPVVTKTGAINIVKGNYILYINPQASQASGVDGGRFAEISMGAPSSDAVNIEPPSPACGAPESHLALTDHPRVDLYINADTAQVWCKTPTSSSTLWYFSYITDKNGSYFNYYTPNSGLGYVVTMSYKSKNIDSFPVKGSDELNNAISTMTGIVKTLQIK